MRLAKIISALALVAALTGCGAATSEQGFVGSTNCLFDSHCDDLFPNTPHHPVVEWNSAQNPTP